MNDIIKAEPSALRQYEEARAAADKAWAEVEAAYEVLEKAGKAHLAAIDAYSRAIGISEEKRVEAFK